MDDRDKLLEVLRRMYGLEAVLRVVRKMAVQSECAVCKQILAEVMDVYLDGD